MLAPQHFGGQFAEGQNCGDGKDDRCYSQGVRQEVRKLYGEAEGFKIYREAPTYADEYGEINI